MATVSYERLFIELTLPADRAEAVIRSRAALSESIRASIDDFQCDQCRPDCNGRKLRNVDNEKIDKLVLDVESVITKNKKHRQGYRAEG